ncbi:peptidylprolyl isomerase [bacterium]|nr:peptidylprolyl isomerase [bacterium]MDB4089010.1 peptidylprolyl isomerase [Flavobacteriales bacterium]
MAAIGEIRKRSWLLVVVIVIGMLAFILGDMLTGRGGTIEQTPVATVNGEEISSFEYQEMVDNEFEKSNRAYQALYKQPAPATMKQQLTDNFMGQYLNQRMFEGEYNKIGLEVTKDQFNDLIQGNKVDGKIYEQFGLFVGPDRKFNADTMKKYLPVYSQDPGFQYVLSDVVGDQAEKTKLQEKYFSMMTKGMYTTSYEAKKEFTANSNTVTFDYVYAPFSSVSDDEVTVTEADFKAYYQKHKNEKKYDQEDKVSFQYIQFPIVASEEDLEIASDYLTTRIELFKNADNDSSFVIQNSDSKNLDFSVATFPAGMDSIVQSADTGTVIGPYRDGEFFKIAKVLENTFKEEAEVRHILLGNDVHSDPVAQKKLADSITRVVTRDKSKFAEMVTLFSTDRGSIANGGKYEWFDDKRMVPEFTEVSFKKPINSVAQAKTTYGIHIIEVLGRRNSKQLKVATVDSEIRRSKATINEVRDRALEFVTSFEKSNISDSAFKNAATKIGLTAYPADQIPVTQKELADFGTNFLQVKKWAFSKFTKEGDLSDDLVFEKSVAISHLKNRTQAGTPSYDDLSESFKNDIRYAVLNEKKAAYLINKMQGASLQEIATANGANVLTTDNATMNETNVAGINEPAVVGTAFGVAANTVSKPIEGVTGVYVINVKTLNEAPLPENFDQQKTSGNTQLRANVTNRAYQALIDATGLKDDRDKVNVLGN